MNDRYKRRKPTWSEYSQRQLNALAQMKGLEKVLHRHKRSAGK